MRSTKYTKYAKCCSFFTPNKLNRMILYKYQSGKGVNMRKIGVAFIIILMLGAKQITKFKKTMSRCET